ncbi:MAG: hypothetical protein HZR80_12900 [Candidatus Heimdallarchaeota archaeon]
MRRPNGGVIWLLIGGAIMAITFSEIMAFFFNVQYLIAAFIILIISGYICARVIGRVGGEFSAGAKSYSILLVGFVFGMAFDLMRFRYDWIINVFKYIAIGTFFILIAVVYKRNLEKYTDQNPTDGPHLGLMRLSILYIITGFSFAMSVNSIVEAFLGSIFFVATLPFLVAIAIFIMITAKADYDLLDDRSGIWNQMLAGGALGIAYDLILFRVYVTQDLLKMFIVFGIFMITASVVRMKEATRISPEGIQLDLKQTKTKKKSKEVGSITITKKKSSQSTTSKKRSYSKSKKSSSKKRRS